MNEDNNNIVINGGKNRNIAVCIILSFVTCGIYCIYWLYVLNEEINTIHGTPDDTSGGAVIAFYLLTCGFYGWYWYYKMGNKIDDIKIKTGAQPSTSAIMFLILGICGLGIVNYAIMQDTINKVSA